MSAILSQMGKYGAVGLAATIIHICSALFFFSFIGIPPMSANTMAFLVAFGFSYWGNSRWTFTSVSRPAAALPRFFALSIVCFLLNQGLIVLAMNLMNLPFLPSVATAAVSAAALAFITSRLWVFAADGGRLIAKH